MSTRAQIEFYDGGSRRLTPAARIYQHCDGYPSGVLPRLEILRRILRKGTELYGPRLADAEWAAAEFVCQFRAKTDAAPDAKSEWKDTEGRPKGNVYVTQSLHPDIEYLYRVYCFETKWDIAVFHVAFAPDSRGRERIALQPCREEELSAA